MIERTSFMRGNRRRQPEHDEQVAVIQWAELSVAKYPALRWLYAVPNGGARHPAVAGKLKAEGVKRGVPDLVLPVPLGSFHGAYVEMKRPGSSPSDVSAEQREWGEHLSKAGYAYCLARSFEAAKAFLVAYLEGRLMEDAA